MKILFLSFYYRPDLSAGSFRSAALVAALEKKLPGASSIDVITSLPNRYKTFSVEATEIEKHGVVTIRRLPLPAHKSGVLDQTRSFLSFSRSVSRLVANKDYDLVVATSSRLMTAVLAAGIARRKKVPLYLDIRDIFVDTIRDVFPRYLSLLVVPLLSVAESFAINSATRINLVSPGFEPYFAARYPDKVFTYFTNGVDSEFIAAFRPTTNSGPPGDGPIRVVYAGNVGEGQGLHLILPELAARMSTRMRFRIFGDGGRMSALWTGLTDKGTSNVEILPPLSRGLLIKEYRDSDVLFLHLNDHAAFRKVLPSKLFEYAAMGKPLWAGVAGYSASFIRSEISNAAVFTPCDVDEAERVFESLVLGVSCRDEFVEKYERRKIVDKMAVDILELVGT
jgi:hypothetical protein